MAEAKYEKLSMKNIQFKESQCDFDHVLIQRGYEAADYDDRVIFTKPIKLETDGTPIKYNEKTLVISVIRPMKLTRQEKKMMLNFLITIKNENQFNDN